MKSIYPKFSLFLLFLAFSIAPLIAMKMPMGEIIVPGDDKERSEDQKLYVQFKDLDMATFQKDIIPLTNQQIDKLLESFLADANKVKNVRDKIILLVEKIPSQKRDGLREELLWAYKNKDRAMIKKLRGLGGDISKALEGAVVSQPDSISLLLRDGAQPDVTVMRSAFFVSGVVSEPIDPELTAKERESARKVRKFLPQLLKAMKNIKQNSFDLLSSVDDPELVAMLLKAGVDINAQEEKPSPDDIRVTEHEGDTALIYAVKRLRNLQRRERVPDFLIFTTKARIKRLNKMIPYLIQQGADPMIKNKKGESALSIAKKAGLKALVQGGKRTRNKSR